MNLSYRSSYFYYFSPFYCLICFDSSQLYICYATAKSISIGMCIVYKCTQMAAVYKARVRRFAKPKWLDQSPLWSRSVYSKGSEDCYRFECSLYMPSTIYSIIKPIYVTYLWFWYLVHKNIFPVMVNITRKNLCKSNDLSWRFKLSTAILMKYCYRRYIIYISYIYIYFFYLLHC